MNLETLLTYFDEDAVEEDHTFYARKDDNLLLVVTDEDTGERSLLHSLIIFFNGGVLGFSEDPDNEAIINVSPDYNDNLPVDVFRLIDVR